MYNPLVIVALCLLASFQPAFANLRVPDLQTAGLRDVAFRKSIRQDASGKHIQMVWTVAVDMYRALLTFAARFQTN